MSLLEGNELDGNAIPRNAFGPDSPSSLDWNDPLLNTHSSTAQPFDGSLLSQRSDDSFASQFFTGDGPSTLVLGLIGIICLAGFDACRGEKNCVPWKNVARRFANFAIVCIALILRGPIQALHGAHFALARLAHRSHPLVRQTLDTLTDDTGDFAGGAVTRR